MRRPFLLLVFSLVVVSHGDPTAFDDDYRPTDDTTTQRHARLLPGGGRVHAVLRDVQQTPATAEARPVRRVLHLPRAREPLVPFCHASRIRMKVTTTYLLATGTAQSYATGSPTRPRQRGLTTPPAAPRRRTGTAP